MSPHATPILQVLRHPWLREVAGLIPAPVVIPPPPHQQPCLFPTAPGPPPCTLPACGLPGGLHCITQPSPLPMDAMLEASSPAALSSPSTPWADCEGLLHRRDSFASCSSWDTCTSAFSMPSSLPSLGSYASLGSHASMGSHASLGDLLTAAASVEFAAAAAAASLPALSSMAAPALPALVTAPLSSSAPVPRAPLSNLGNLPFAGVSAPVQPAQSLGLPPPLMPPLVAGQVATQQLDAITSGPILPLIARLVATEYF